MGAPTHTASIKSNAIARPDHFRSGEKIPQAGRQANTAAAANTWWLEIHATLVQNGRVAQAGAPKKQHGPSEERDAIGGLHGPLGGASGTLH